MAWPISDTFTGTAGNTLQAYSAGWVKHGSSLSDAQITAAGRARVTTASSDGIYYNAQVPPSADYEVSADLYCVSNINAGTSQWSGAALLARADTSANTFYWVRFLNNAGTNAWELLRRVAGANVSLGTFNQTLTPGLTYTVKLRCVDTALTVYVDGVSRITATDSNITAAGRAGLMVRQNASVAPSDSTGYHLDNFVTQTYTANLLPGLISYWKLDEASGDALDAHSTNHLTQAGSVGTAAGKVGTARDFPGTSGNYFSHVDNADLSTGDIDWTFACWLYADVLPAGNFYIAHKGHLTGFPEWRLYYNSGGSFWFHAHNGSTEAFCSKAHTVVTGTWYFVIAGHDSVNNQITVFVNNVAGTPAAHTGGVQNGPGAFELGTQSNQPASIFWDGRIDEVGFWKRVLTADERAWLYNGGAGRGYGEINPTPPPVVVPFKRGCIINAGGWGGNLLGHLVNAGG